MSDEKKVSVAAYVFGLDPASAGAEAALLAEKDAAKCKAAKRDYELDQKALAKCRAAEARLPDDMTLRTAAIEGCHRMARRIERDGKPERAVELGKLADEAGEILRDYALLTGELQERRPDPLGDAANKAAKQLVKTLSACFDNAEEARCFALRFLPLTSARAEATRQADRFGAIARRRAQRGSDFWKPIERAVRVAGLEEVRALVNMGML